VRGCFRKFRTWVCAVTPPHPASQSDLSPQAGRGGPNIRADSTQHHHALANGSAWGPVIASASEAIQTSSFRDGPKDQTSDVQLHIGESLDSGFDAPHRPGMTDSGLLRRFRLRSLSYSGQVAPRNDVAPISKTRLRVLAARCVRGFAIDFASSEFRGRRECRALNAPAASCVKKQTHERSHHRYTE